MDVNQVNELGKKAFQKIQCGDFEGALKPAYEILDLGPHYFVSYTTSALLIDIGNALGDETITKQGVELLENDLKEIVQHDEKAPSAYYNLANGYYVLFQFKRARDYYFACFKETELNKAKLYFRKALEYNPQNDMFMSQILVNLANCYDTFGRVLDALEFYEEALKHKPNHGMALGNKGLAIKYYAELAGEHQRTYLLEAHYLFLAGIRTRSKSRGC